MNKTKEQKKVIEIRCVRCKRMLCKFLGDSDGDVNVEFKCGTCKRIITIRCFFDYQYNEADSKIFI